MKAVIQRVHEAAVDVEGRRISAIGSGCLVLVGVEQEDTAADACFMARKILGLRLFGDTAGRMNRSVEEVGGEILVVSQFTLAASLERGRRPSFAGAAPQDRARELYQTMIAALEKGQAAVRTGLFGASMQVFLVNDGPVTFILQAPMKRRP
ncbi:MAG: D-aminoacyl-tRNA deacylase [Acidobacteriota bacterium]